jgi:phage terminase large subunit-like protein
MTRRSKGLRRVLGIDTSVNSIFQETTASKFVPISSDSKGLEGLNVHFAVLDEIGSYRTGRVYDVILTGLGKRLQPMLVSISTATSNNTGAGKQLWNYTLKVLDGVINDERFFGVIYAAADDDPWAERTMRKANPGWGITVVAEQIKMIARQAKNNPAQETIYKTRHLNLWVTGNAPLFSMEHWRLCKNEALDLSHYEGRPCILGLDIADKIDLAAAIVIFWDQREDGETVYTAFATTWLPEARIEGQPLYAQWIKDGWLSPTTGETTDYNEIEAFITDCRRRFAVQALPYDPWSATQLAHRMMAEDVPMVEYPMNVSTMSEPTKFLDVIIREHRIRHNGDPVLAWTLSNVVGHRDAKDNIYPRKQEAENKIDPAIALIMALGQHIVRDAEGTETVYKGDAELRVW